MRVVIVISILILILISGCSDKKNVIGEGTDLHPYLVDIRAEDLFEYYYAYENETGNFIRNTKSIVGNFRGNESITLIRFSNLPDSNFVLQEDPQLILTMNKHYNSEGMNLRFGTISQIWDPLHVSWEKSGQDSLWHQSWDDYSNMTILEEIVQQISETDSTLTVNLPMDLMTDLIQGWIKDTPETYGLAIFADLAENNNNSYVEFFSRETSDGPVLKFEYLAAPGDTTFVTYERMPIYNSFINSKQPVDGYYIEEEILVGNIVPTRSVVKLNLQSEYFNPLPEDDDLKKITVNKAELILFKQTQNEASHFAEQLFQIYPYYLINEFSPEEIGSLPIAVENMGIVNPTYTSIISETADSVAVNITSIVQSHISELKDNYGLVISSSLENKDNSFISFYPPNTLDESKKPYLRVIYTLPFEPQ